MKKTLNSSWKQPLRKARTSNRLVVLFYLIDINMSCKWVQGKTRLRAYPKQASTAFAKDALVYWISGYVNPADSTSGDHIGITAEAITSASANYATAGATILVEVPADKQCVFEATTTGTLAATGVGATYDLSDSVTVNAGAQAKNVVTCVKFISATKGRYVLNASFDTYRVATS